MCRCPKLLGQYCRGWKFINISQPFPCCELICRTTVTVRVISSHRYLRCPLNSIASITKRTCSLPLFSTRYWSNLRMWCQGIHSWTRISQSPSQSILPLTSYFHSFSYLTQLPSLATWLRWPFDNTVVFYWNRTRVVFLQWVLGTLSWYHFAKLGAPH